MAGTGAISQESVSGCAACGARVAGSALDEKINASGKIEPHEIASKTQMFTERYMVEWLLQNSLGLTWLCMCRKHGWTADAESGAFQQLATPLNKKKPTGIGFSELHASLSCWRKLAVVGR